MDPKAAEEYHTLLQMKLREKRNYASNLGWIPVLAASGYFALSGVSGAIFGGLIGYALCAILTRTEDFETTIFYVEALRHLHEHTNEAEDGKRIADIQISLDRAAKKWW